MDDTHSKKLVALVIQEFARQHGRNQNLIGRHLINFQRLNLKLSASLVTCGARRVPSRGRRPVRTSTCWRMAKDVPSYLCRPLNPPYRSTAA